MRHFKLIVVAALAQIAAALPIDAVQDILKSPEKFEAKDVRVVGKVKDFKQKTSKIGKSYFTFGLMGLDGSPGELKVFSSGKLEPAPKYGDRVEVSGVFYREKLVYDFKVRNEIDASPTIEKGSAKYGVKVLKDQ